MKNIDPVKKDWGLTPLHQKMLEILIYIHTFCEENDIDYCLAYGSALGAKRHGGFIPWDDDADICMTAEGFNRFRRLFKEKGDHEKYYFQELESESDLCAFAKLRMNGTMFMEPLMEGCDIHHGIYVDIFILHNTTGKKREIRNMILARKYLDIKRLSNLHYCRRKLYIPILAFLRLFPYNFGRKRALKCIYQADMIDTEYFFEVEYKANNVVCPKTMFFPAKTMFFEGMELCVPADIDGNLKNIYGDYMQIPSMEDIKWKQHVALWDVEKDFRETVPYAKNFDDEKKA